MDSEFDIIVDLIGDTMVCDVQSNKSFVIDS